MAKGKKADAPVEIETLEQAIEAIRILTERLDAMDESNAALAEQVAALEESNTACKDQVKALEESNAALAEQVAELEESNKECKVQVKALEEKPAMQVEEFATKIKELSEAVAKVSTVVKVEIAEPKPKPVLPKEAQFSLSVDGKVKNFELLIPQYSIPVTKENKVTMVLMTAEELLTKNTDGSYKNETALRILVEGKLNKYVAEVK